MEEFTPKLVGARVKRREDQRLLTGQGAYVDDHHPPGTLYAAFLRSPYAHALITQLDTSEAQTLEGVVSIVTGEDLVPRVKPVRAASMNS